MAPASLLFLLVAANLLRLAPQTAAAVNRTIDDSSVEFTFAGNWLANSCSKCNPQPDSGHALNGTWHTNDDDGATMRLQFTGSAIWLFGILAPAATQGSLTITLDSQSPVAYNVSGNSNSSYIYDKLLFSASSLSTSTHNLTLEAGVGSPSGHSILIDYAVVNVDFLSTATTSEFGVPTISGASGGASTSSSRSQVGQTIGAVIGTLVGLAIIGILIRRYRRPFPEICTPPQPPATYCEETRVVFPVTVSVRPVTAYDTEPPPVYRP
ncbi:hypothetical protein E1B28_003191 [Marasmius oreades]|uniref:Uncharacterized protein n=1 Tax=Marasmius oreades TaxID=181124 RepID=A0A9P7RL80_9AGAR|nr:uncharacterized protein E1B28_003191 [Marasmius oreades]KAG7085644.1 hypothetical protein E1B28_003191 [Marasmius oreades]